MFFLILTGPEVVPENNEACLSFNELGNQLMVAWMLLPIERGLGRVLQNIVKFIEAAHVNGVTIGVHSGSTKRMNATNSTEPVARFICTELVVGKALFTLYQRKTCIVHWVMQDTLFATY